MGGHQAATVGAGIRAFTFDDIHHVIPGTMLTRELSQGDLDPTPSRRRVAMAAPLAHPRTFTATTATSVLHLGRIFR